MTAVSNDTYLQQILDEQDLSPEQLGALRTLRDQIQQQLSVLQGSPRFYYAGSFAKKTMIRQAYDLDVVIYWPSDCGYTLKSIHDAVGDVLKKHWKYVTQKTVAWELQFEGGFWLDVVPGRAIDGTFKYANLYRTDTGTSLQTSIKVHIDTVRDSGRRDVIRLMKLWRTKRAVPLKKSLALELLTIDGCNGLPVNALEKQLIASLRYVRDNILTVRLIDPANSNNVLSDEISTVDRRAIQVAAQTAIDAQYWRQVLT